MRFRESISISISTSISMRRAMISSALNPSRRSPSLGTSLSFIALATVAVFVGCGDAEVAPPTAPDTETLDRAGSDLICLDPRASGTGGDGSIDGGGGEGAGEPGEDDDEDSDDDGCGGEPFSGGVDGGLFFGGGAGSGCPNLTVIVIGDVEGGDGAFELPHFDGGSGGSEDDLAGFGPDDGSGAGRGGVIVIELGDVGSFDAASDGGLGGRDTGPGADVEDLCCFASEAICPSGPHPDCPHICGDGIVQRPYETCDGDCDTITCPTEVEACGVYLNRRIQGSPELCNVFCGGDARQCVTGDACCPEELFCDFRNDGDCPEPEGELGGRCSRAEDCGGEPFACITPEGGHFLGGYCTIVDLNCPPDSTRILFPAFVGFLQPCFKNCESDDDCREGYACYDWAFTGQDICAPIGIGELPQGAACENSWECAGGPWVGCAAGTKTCRTFCNIEGPVEQPDICPGDDICYNGVCEERCSVCVTGDGCCPEGLPFPCLSTQDAECEIADVPVGAPCTDVSQCGEDDRAVCLGAESGFPGGYCSITAQHEFILECPEGSIRSTFAQNYPDSPYIGDSGLGLYCATMCDDDTSCGRSGYGCYRVDLTPIERCGPLPNGSAGLNEPCQTVADCAGDPGTLCRAGRCARPCDFADDTFYCPLGGSFTCDNRLDCQPICTSAAECRAGEICELVGFSGDRYCSREND